MASTRLSSRSVDTLLTHRPLIPDVDEVAVRISELCTVSPVQFLWSLLEGHAAPGQFVILRFHIVDLKRQRARWSPVGTGTLDQKQRQISVVLEGDGLAAGHFEFDLET